MKNIIKIITVLAIVTSFFSVYSMEESDKTTTIREHPWSEGFFYINDLNSIPDMMKLPLHPSYGGPTSFAPDLSDNLTLVFNAIKVIKELQKERQEKILQKIHDDLSQGLPTSLYYTVSKSHFDPIGWIKHSQKPIPLNTIIQDWFKDTNFDKQEKKEAYNCLISTIQQGQSSYTLKISNILITCILNKFKIEIPEVLATFLLSFVYNV